MGTKARSDKMKSDKIAALINMSLRGTPNESTNAKSILERIGITEAHYINYSYELKRLFGIDLNKKSEPKAEPRTRYSWEVKHTTVKRPKKGKCRMIWDILDDARRKGTNVTRKYAVSVLTSYGYNKGTAGTQWRQWAIYNGLYNK